jgi:hypothetical protein
VTNVYADITDDQLINALRAVVAESPETVYSLPDHMEPEYTDACYYVHTDPSDETKLSPGCVVGAALDRLGVPLEDLQKREGQGAYVVLNELLPNVSMNALRFASDLQMFQDQRDPWSEALTQAEEMHAALV